LKQERESWDDPARAVNSPQPEERKTATRWKEYRPMHSTNKPPPPPSIREALATP
jgi:hypothetical protein